MESELKASKSSKPKKRLTWSQETKVGDTTKTIRVEKLDNVGYLVIISKQWYDKKGMWNNEESKLYYETNPLAEEKDNTIDKFYTLINNSKN